MKKIAIAILLCSITLATCPFSQIQKGSLLNYAKSTYSQRGEEGIFEEMMRRIGVERGFFVEFGATDGIYFSNTRKLAESGWQGAYIESNPASFEKLVKNYKKFPNILCIKEFVTWTPKDDRGLTLDAIADKYFPDTDIDILSIDIDGGDYLVLESLKRKPKVICVEGGFAWDPRLKLRIPDEVALQNLQQPLAVTFAIAKEQGYVPVCFTQNVFLVRQDFADLFKDIVNDPVTLWYEALLYWKNNFPDDYQFLIDFRNTNAYVKAYENGLQGDHSSLDCDLSKHVVDIIGIECEQVLNYVKRYLPEDPVIVEAGAFNGEDSEKIARFWPKSILHSFEPVPELFHKVVARVSECSVCSNIKIYKLALSEKTGVATLNLSQINPGEVSGSSSLLKPKDTLIYDPYIKFVDTIEVPTITLENWGKSNNISKIDFLWLDMQGTELNALKAAGPLLDTVKVIYTEVELKEAYEGQYLYSDVKSWLESKGFTEVARDFNIPHYWFWGDAVFVRNDVLCNYLHEAQ